MINFSILNKRFNLIKARQKDDLYKNYIKFYFVKYLKKLFIKYKDVEVYIAV